ncbi:MAG: hypothetical protein NVSMB31_01620 [Vulcanimicrobiaceae bacterium]
MSAVILALLSAILVVAQVVLPGTAWFHHGSYAALLLTIGGLQLWAWRRSVRGKNLRANGLALVVFGSAVLILAGLASALLAPDAQTVVRGPGESVPLSEPAGVLQFPIDALALPLFHRPGHLDMSLSGAAGRYLPTYVFQIEPRAAASIQVADSHGRHLTMTQPTNTSFLSPVLLFAQTTDIGGHQLPVDSFAVPAQHRAVKAVLFAADAIARMGTNTARDPRPGVLFAVEDERGRVLPGAIGLARTRDTIALGGLRFRAEIITFPAVVILPVPNLPVVLLGLLLLATGAVMATVTRARGA